MGLYPNSYAGPYVLGTCSLIEEKQFIKVCSNCNAGSKKGLKAKFCKQCGTETVSKETKPKTVVQPSYHQHCEAMHDAGLSEDAFDNISEFGPNEGETHLLIPNQNKEGRPRRFHIENENSVFVKLGDIDTQSELEWFQKAFAQEIEVLKSLYSEIEIGWAFIKYSR